MTIKFVNYIDKPLGISLGCDAHAKNYVASSPHSTCFNNTWQLRYSAYWCTLDAKNRLISSKILIREFQFLSITHQHHILIFNSNNILGTFASKILFPISCLAFSHAMHTMQTILSPRYVGKLEFYYHSASMYVGT